MKNSVARRNPYVIGRPIDERELFVGREGLFSFIQDNLKQNQQVILLHGQRRIGKSSIIRNIPKFVALDDDFLFVPFDLEHHTRDEISTIFFEMAQEIVESLELSTKHIKLPTIGELKQEPFVFYSKFLPQVHQEIDGKKLVLLLDEFDVSTNNEDSSQALENLFIYFDSILELDSKLFIILFLGRQSTDMPNILSTFKNAPIAEIGLLDEANSQRLITKPAEGILKYEPTAIQEIIALSAGHPYFTQSICFAIFGRARELDKWQVTREDVNASLDKAIELAEAGLAWFWDGLSIWEQIVFAAVAEAQKQSHEKYQKIPEDPLEILKEHGIIPIDWILKAAKQLINTAFLDENGRKVKIEFVRRWLVQRHPLRQEIEKLEKIEKSKINPVSKDIDKNQKKIANFETETVKFQPKDFSTIPAQAEGYLKLGNFNEALELYTQAYKFDPIHNKEGLLYTLEKYGNNLLKQLEFKTAKEQFNRILEIEPSRISALQKKQEIETYERKTINSIVKGNINGNSVLINSLKSYYNILNKQRVFVFSTLTAMTVIIGFVSVSVSLISNSCTPSEKKVFGLFCQSNPKANISNGDRTLFPLTANTNLKQGNIAFKKENYRQAAFLFKGAVKNNPNDPEALIYYNNARALQQQKSPFTLAVIVPAGNNSQSTAKEMLRGVAQAQSQFNKNGLNGKSLKVVIANDSNEPKKAQEIAAELVKDKNLLGVIGHANSDATEAALVEYERAGIATISPTNTSEFLESPVFFRTVNSEKVVAEKLAQYASINLNLKKIIVFCNPKSHYSESLTTEFAKQFKKLGGEIDSKSLINFTNPEVDVKKEVAKTIDRYQPQAFVLFPDTQHTSNALQIATASKGNMYTLDNPNSNRLQLLAGDTLYSNKTLTSTRNQVEGLIIAVPWFREAPQAKNFAETAAEQWGGAVSWRTATSFDATQAFIHSFSQNSDRKTVLQNLKNLNLPASETSGYPLQFNGGERESKPVLVKVEGGKFVEVPEQ